MSIETELAARHRRIEDQLTINKEAIDVIGRLEAHRQKLIAALSWIAHMEEVCGGNLSDKEIISQVKLIAKEAIAP